MKRTAIKKMEEVYAKTKDGACKIAFVVSDLVNGRVKIRFKDCVSAEDEWYQYSDLEKIEDLAETDDEDIDDDQGPQSDTATPQNNRAKVWEG